MRRSFLTGTTVLLSLLFASCASVPAGPPPASAGPAVVTASATPMMDPSVWGVDPAVVQRVRALCAPGPGKTVRLLDDVVIPAIDEPAVRDAGGRVGNRIVPPVDVPAVSWPATTGEAGCVVTYEAPAGCLPRVEISEAWIPGAPVPGYRITQADGTVTQVPDKIVPAQVKDGDVAEESCQVTTENYQTRALRASALRTLLLRPSLLRPMSLRKLTCEGTDCVSAVSVPGLWVPGVAMPATHVPAEHLPFRVLRDGVDTTTSDHSTAYHAQGDVLFAYNQHDLLPEATTVLDAILADATAHGFDGRVRVEGHTDDTGDTDSNQHLSELRARAVADYLTGRGIPAARITTTGRGETVPAYPNDSDANRARNRRVVIEFNRT
nr:OmpA family protein [Propionibacterium sp.]